jgi:hypothetical protein
MYSHSLILYLGCPKDGPDQTKGLEKSAFFTCPNWPFLFFMGVTLKMTFPGIIDRGGIPVRECVPQGGER